MVFAVAAAAVDVALDAPLVAAAAGRLVAAGVDAAVAVAFIEFFICSKIYNKFLNIILNPKLRVSGIVGGRRISDSGLSDRLLKNIIHHSFTSFSSLSLSSSFFES